MKTTTTPSRPLSLLAALAVAAVLCTPIAACDGGGGTPPSAEAPPRLALHAQMSVEILASVTNPNSQPKTVKVGGRVYVGWFDCCHNNSEWQWRLVQGDVPYPAWPSAASHTDRILFDQDRIYMARYDDRDMAHSVTAYGLDLAVAWVYSEDVAGYCDAYFTNLTLGQQPDSVVAAHDVGPIMPDEPCPQSTVLAIEGGRGRVLATLPVDEGVKSLDYEDGQLVCRTNVTQFVIDYPVRPDVAAAADPDRHPWLVENGTLTERDTAGAVVGSFSPAEIPDLQGFGLDGALLRQLRPGHYYGWLQQGSTAKLVHISY